MKSLICIAAAVALLSLTGMAAAATPNLDSFSSVASPQSVVPEHEVSACALAFVEDRTVCQFAVIASNDCPAAAVTWLQLHGAQLLGTPAYIADCLGGTPDARSPPG